MSLIWDCFDTIIYHCQNSPIGKRLAKALYVHTSALGDLSPLLQDYERQGRLCKEIEGATLVKFSTDRPKISYLFYPKFDRDPHPALSLSVVVNLETSQVNFWNYSDGDNPPILHRKETFVTPDYPLYQEFAHLTRLEESLGLLDHSHSIGTRRDWESLLDQYRLAFVGHYLTCPLSSPATANLPVEIERHKAAIARKTLSRPVRLALEAGLFTAGSTTFFDYGCGYGSDIESLEEMGYASSGWDPYYRPDSPLNPADIVNLGYIINVIENPQERREALLEAWKLTRQVLIVAAQVLIDDRDRGTVAYGDGIITRRNTFQKYYEQEELKAYIDRVLEVDAIPAGLGIYLVFREEAQAQAFRVSRFHSQATTPKIWAKVRRFEDYQDLLLPLMEFMADRGRLPVKGELNNELELKAEFGTFRRAFQCILQVTKEEEWDNITDKRRQELLLYLALSNFDHRPKIRELSPEVRADIKALFGGYQQACMVADMMLISLRDLGKIADLCQASSVGKKLKKSLLVHISALETLPTLLRLYEGCASRTFGRLEEANVIRLSFHEPKVSYLFFPEFDDNPHPLLQSSMEIYLGDVTVKYRDFSRNKNPLILHEKNLLVTPNYPHYKKFTRLTKQEKSLGLLDDLQAISRRQGWLQCLRERGVTLQGYEIMNYEL